MNHDWGFGFVDERRHPFIFGGITACDITLLERGEFPYWCRTHRVGFTDRGYRFLETDLAPFDSPDYCPSARLEAWKLRRYNEARRRP